MTCDVQVSAPLFRRLVGLFGHLFKDYLYNLVVYGCNPGWFDHKKETEIFNINIAFARTVIYVRTVIHLVL